MPPAAGDPHPRIGAALEQERERQGLSLSDLEERTKIRTRYLRALETEDWDIIPGPTYVRGFLRAYAEALGLDPEELVDDYREEFEPAQPRRGLGEGVLTEYRGPNGRGSRFNRRWLIAGLVVGLVALLLVLGLWGGSGDDDAGEDRGGAERGKAEGDREGGDGAAGGGGAKPEKGGEGVPDTVELELTPRSDSEICLVNKGGAVLIDNQVLSPGEEEKFEAGAFDLSLGFGEVALTINGDTETIKTKVGTRVTYTVTPKRLGQPVADGDPECP